MDDNKNIFDYIKQLFTSFGIVVLLFIAINIIIGNEASSVSSLFALGAKGLSTATLLQLLFLVLIITVAQNIFLSDLVIKNMALVVRNILFFATIMAAITVFAVVFGWFPLNNVAAWIGFIVSFAFCSVISSVIMRLEENAENKKMQDALNRLKK
ncbi:MAG: DUF3021 family protein [Clostridiales bacterium]|nr:DUF3021 family protein [Clostridiales bacterium]